MINTYNILVYLKQNVEWCNWKYEERDGKFYQSSI